MLNCALLRAGTLSRLSSVSCLLVAMALLAGASSPASADGPAKTRGVRVAAARNVDADAPKNPFPDRFKAGDLDGGEEWLNTAGPITLKDLRGKVVLIDFWTFCCINCIHVLPDLKYLERKYPNELVVIGCHSAKFDNEKETGNIRKAIARYEIEHPVINDAKMQVWNKFQVRSWPTLVLIDPEGFYCGFISGEGNREQLDAVIERLIAYHKSKGTIDETPVRFDLERDKMPPTPLRFPGKLLADETGNRLFISDSNHNRIVVTTLDGQLLATIGSGAIGNKDGTFAAAQFDHPQGMALVGETLYVADTENHLLRAVDLTSQTVSTLAGTGLQARQREQGGPLKDTPLNSPWDLCVQGNVMYVAMAGPHQLWAHELGSNKIRAYAGSGREDILNGSLTESALAQPSGIASDGKFLYVCDSEGSSIRKITQSANLASPKGEVTTVVGTSDLPSGRSLFAFGDENGEGKAVRLQHPLGLAFHDGALFVADSYNHKIKKVDLKTRRATTWLGTGEPGTGLDPVDLSEPAGVAVANGNLYVADTNNHRICVSDLTTKATRVLEIAGLAPPVVEDVDVDVTTGKPATVLPAQTLAVQNENGESILKLNVGWSLPPGYKRNDQIPLQWKVTSVEPPSAIAATVVGKRLAAEADLNSGVIRLPVPPETAGTVVVELTVSLGYCRDSAGGLCKYGSERLRIPVEVSPSGAATGDVQLNFLK